MKHKAIVKVMLNVEVPDHWGDDCTIEQVRKQASSWAMNKVRNILKEHNRIVIISDPKVTIMFFEED